MVKSSDQSEIIDYAAARRHARRIVLITVWLMAVAAVLGVVAAVFLPSGDGGHHRGAIGVVVAFVVVVVLVGVSVPLLLRVYRRPNYARVLQYGWGQRRRVGKALRKGRPLAPADRPVADALVRTMRRQRWLPFVFGALILLNVPRVLFEDGLQRAFGIALLVMYAVLLPVIIWQRRRIFANYDRLEPMGQPATPTPQ